MPGRGGISRGRADARLRYLNDTQGGTEAYEARILPPGTGASAEWERLGLRRAEPTVAPQRATAPGGAADAGSGEASWRRRLAPRHRAVVRRFFSGGK